MKKRSTAVLAAIGIIVVLLSACAVSPSKNQAVQVPGNGPDGEPTVEAKTLLPAELMFIRQGLWSTNGVWEKKQPVNLSSLSHPSEYLVEKGGTTPTVVFWQTGKPFLPINLEGLSSQGSPPISWPAVGPKGHWAVVQHDTVNNKDTLVVDGDAIFVAQTIASPAFSSENSLAFSAASQMSADADIYIINLNQPKVARRLNLKGIQKDGRFSPAFGDERNLFFVSGSQTKFDIYWTKLPYQLGESALEVTRVTDSGDAISPAYDSGVLVFARCDQFDTNASAFPECFDGRSDIWVADTNASSAHRLIKNGKDPAWVHTDLFVLPGNALEISQDNSSVRVAAEITTTAVPALQNSATSGAGKVEKYKQDPTDTVPTRVHNKCPVSEKTSTGDLIQPGQVFYARLATQCSPYTQSGGKKISRILEICSSDGKSTGKYVVGFDSIKPVAAVAGSITSLLSVVPTSVANTPITDGSVGSTQKVDSSTLTDLAAGFDASSITPEQIGQLLPQICRQMNNSTKEEKQQLLETFKQFTKPEQAKNMGAFPNFCAILDTALPGKEQEVEKLVVELAVKGMSSGDEKIENPMPGIKAGSMLGTICAKPDMIDTLGGLFPIPASYKAMVPVMCALYNSVNNSGKAILANLANSM